MAPTSATPDDHAASWYAPLHTPADFIRWAATAFVDADLSFAHGLDTALDEAYYLVRYALNLPHGVPEVYLGAQLLDHERAEVAELLLRRIDARIPAAYLTNEAWFAGAAFYVDERVIIPRSPVAELIEREFVPPLPHPPTHVLDLCCGGGCIGIATALHLPEAQVVLADLSADALAVAQINIDGFGLGDRVQTVESDLFANIRADDGGPLQFDLIVCNPPYVPTAEVDALPAEFDHEPRMSLESGDDGMLHPRQVVEQAADFLTPDGVLILEVGAWAEELVAEFPDLELQWLDFARGGLGVAAITRTALLAAQ